MSITFYTIYVLVSVIALFNEFIDAFLVVSGCYA